MSQQSIVFLNRIQMCNDFRSSSEIEQSVRNLVSAATILEKLGSYDAETVLEMAESLCYKHVLYLQQECESWEEYEAFPAEVFKYFTGGCNKLTKAEWEIDKSYIPSLQEEADGLLILNSGCLHSFRFYRSGENEIANGLNGKTINLFHNCPPIYLEEFRIRGWLKKEE